MWPKVSVFIFMVSSVLAEELFPGFDRTIMTDGVTSLGYKVMYGDEDIMVLSNKVDETDKKVLKKRPYLNDAIQPLKAEDLKCIMSTDQFCTKEMGETKSVLIQAVQEDCEKCSTEQKERAGKVIASLMAYDHVAWKMFLTRYGGEQDVERILG